MWPQQQRLVRDLREVLRRSFGCQDAWVVAGGGRCRLEIRVAGRQITLLDDAEALFWGRFYTQVQRSRLHMGEQVTQTILWRKSAGDVAGVLSGPWMERVGPLPARQIGHPPAVKPPRA